MSNQDEREALRGDVLRELERAVKDDLDLYQTTDAIMVLAANFHRTPSPSVVTTVEELEAQLEDWAGEHDDLMGIGKPAGSVVPSLWRFLAGRILATSPPPSEVRVTAEDFEVLAGSLSQHFPSWQPDETGDGMGDGPNAGWGCDLCDIDLDGSHNAALRHALIASIRAAGIPVAEEESP